MKLFTIGFTQTTAEQFFTTLRSAHVARVLDARLKRDGQLSGFAKVPDLPYFLRELAVVGYEPIPSLAPAADLLQHYRAKALTWDEYAERYLELLSERRPERIIDIAMLGSEYTPQRCHRRLAAEYLRQALGSTCAIEIIHL